MQTYEVIEIAKSGVNLVINASKYKKHELVEIIKALKEGSNIVLTNVNSLKKHELLDIAKVNPSVITFEI